MRYRKKRFLSREFGDGVDKKRILIIALAIFLVVLLAASLAVYSSSKRNVKRENNNSSRSDDTERGGSSEIEPGDSDSISDGQNESEMYIAEPAGTPHYVVSDVRDGDTIEVLYGSNSVQAIRLIGVDTPETVHPEKPVECYGPEASAYTKNALKGREVGVELDSSQGEYDAYDRILAYVYIDGRNFNLDLIKNGYGYEYTFNEPYRYQKAFREAESYAVSNALGLWSVCEGITSM